MCSAAFATKPARLDTIRRYRPGSGWVGMPRIYSMPFVNKRNVDITRAMQDAGDLNTFRDDPIEDLGLFRAALTIGDM